MIRLLLGLILALGLAAAPMAADAEPAIGDHMPKCTMSQMPDNPIERSKMACCTIACQAVSAATILQAPNAADGLAPVDRPRLSWAADRQLASRPSPTSDPPPRA